MLHCGTHVFAAQLALTYSNFVYFFFVLFLQKNSSRIFDHYFGHYSCRLHVHSCSTCVQLLYVRFGVVVRRFFKRQLLVTIVLSTPLPSHDDVL